MKHEKLSKAIGEINERHLKEAMEYRPSAGIPMEKVVKFASIAASLIACVLIGFGVLKNNATPDDTNIVIDDNQNATDENTDNAPSSDGSSNVGTNGNQTDDPVSDPPIIIKSLDELEKMRNAISYTGDNKLKDYLASIQGGGAQSREDLIKFVSIVDSMPYMALLDGEITNITLSSGESIDTGKPYCILSVVCKAKNGDWVRFEYNLLISNTQEKIKEEIENSDSAAVLTPPVQNKDRYATVYSQKRKPHATDPGEMITFLVDIHNVFTRIYYYTTDSNTIASTLFENKAITKITGDYYPLGDNVDFTVVGSSMKIEFEQKKGTVLVFRDADTFSLYAKSNAVPVNKSLYDEAYFQEKTLILVFSETIPSSMEKDVTISEIRALANENGTNRYTVTIRYEVPLTSTDDVTYQCFAIETDATPDLVQENVTSAHLFVKLPLDELLKKQ